jgi:hypothetical protein
MNTMSTTERRTVATRRREIPPRQNARDWGPGITEAKRHPGEWVLVFEQAPRSLPNAHVRGKIGALISNHWCFDLITRNTNGIKADIWIRARTWAEVEAEEAEAAAAAENTGEET